jgi:hypothetical protein
MKTITMLVVIATLSATRVAAAQEGVLSPPPPTPPTEQQDSARMERARFSGKRLFVEILVGGLVGSLAAYGTFSAMCGDEACLSGAITGFLVNFAVTPIAVWGTGNMMGGQGSLKGAYLGASIAVTPLSMPGQPDETPGETISRINLEMAISVIVLPITSAILYEFTSGMKATRWKQQHATPVVGVQPIYGRAGLEGVMAGAAVAF